MHVCVCVRACVCVCVCPNLVHIKVCYCWVNHDAGTLAVHLEKYVVALAHLLIYVRIVSTVSAGLREYNTIVGPSLLEGRRQLLVSRDFLWYMMCK